jgi:hypothetical protein
MSQGNLLFRINIIGLYIIDGVAVGYDRKIYFSDKTNQTSKDRIDTCLFEIAQIFLPSFSWLIS